MNETTIEELFEKQTREIELQLNNGGSTDNIELQKYGKANIKHFQGVYAQNSKIEDKMISKFIINVDTEEQAGSHWVAVYKNKDKYYVFDSFGRKTTKLLKLFSKNKLIIDSDYDENQRRAEENCGQRCLSWLMMIDKYGIRAALKI